MTKYDVKTLEELGSFTKKLREEVKEIIKIGTKFSEIVEFVEDKIFEKGYLPAFPCTVCVNEIAAHFTFFDEDFELKKGDLVKVDFGVCHNDIITDNAFTIEVENNVYKNLLESNEEALEKVLEKSEVGTTMSEIGKIVEKVAEKNGYNTIHNLAGHEIKAKDLHAGLHVPNYENNDLSKIGEDITLAIEPFFTTGDPMICEKGQSNILHLKKDVNTRDIIAKRVLKYIKENFRDLPFSKRWLLKEFNSKKVLYALKILKSQGIIYEYPILVSVSSNMISQFEHTVVFVDNKKQIITK